MALSFGIPDAIAFIKISMQLYDNFIGVAKDAKHEFGMFSRELKNLKSTLEGIRKECGANGKLANRSNSADERGLISDLEEAVEFTKESLKCWNSLLEDFGRRSQTIPWRIAWARKYPKLTQCRDRIHVQSKLLEIVMLRMQSSQNSVIISEVQDMKQQLKTIIPPLPSISDTDRLPDSGDQMGDESSDHSLQDVTLDNQSCRTDVASIIQIVDGKISRLRLQKRPIFCRSQVPGNTPPKEFIERFQDSVRRSEHEEPLPEDWLRLGTWWILKSIKLYELLGASHTAQPYVDFLKSSWILYSVLGMNNIQSPETQEMISSLSPQEWTLLENLSSAIGSHTNSFVGASVPSDASLALANFGIWERVAAEEFDTGDTFEPALDPRRWITIEDEHSGSDDEEVLYRSFVQAQIGGRAMRLLVEDTDYLLVLVVPSEETEPTVVLSNLVGTMNLSCSCSSFQWDNEGLENHTARRIVIPFGRKTVPVTFKTSADYNKFTSLAQRYLKAVRDREPTGTENEIFRSILQDYGEKNVNSGRPIQSRHIPNHGSRYWELRIHERTWDKYWGNVRRLVVSGCARAQTPKCISLFLPPSWVYVHENPQDSSEITIKWSDCNQKDTATGGSFDLKYSYKWIPDSPNNCIKFSFLNEYDAKRFSEIVLSLNVCPVSKVRLQSWRQNNPEYQLFRVRDMKRGNSQEHYKALVVTKSHNSWTGTVSSYLDMGEIWKHSEIYFFGKEVDYTIDDNSNSQSTIELMKVYSPLYLSTHVDEPRDATTTPKFSHTVTKVGKVTITLDTTLHMDGLRRQVSPPDRWDFIDMPVTAMAVQEFISALSDSWSVVLSMRVVCIEFVQPSLFMAKPKKIPVYIQVWRNGTSETLVARRIQSSSGDSPEWISVKGATESSFSDAASYATNSDRMVIQKCTIWRGTLLDTTRMQATNEKDSEPVPLNVGEFVIRFQHTRQRDEFKDAFRLRRANSHRYSGSIRSNDTMFGMNRRGTDASNQTAKSRKYL